jgi:hypothetical protein
VTEPVVRNWYIRRDGNVTGPLTESELRSRLPMLTQPGIEIRQGDSQWYPPAVVAQKFEQLADQGVYVRRSGQVEGPYTAIRAVEVLQDHPTAEVKEGKSGPWIPAPAYLAQLKNRSADGKRVRAQCPHCEKTLVMLASLAGKAANCPNCSRSFRVPGDAKPYDQNDSPSPKVPAVGNQPGGSPQASTVPKAPIVVSSANVKVISSQTSPPSAAKVDQSAPTTPPASPKGPTVVQVSSRPSGAWNTSGVPVKAVPVSAAVPVATAVPVLPGTPTFELDDFSPPPASLRPGGTSFASPSRQPGDRSIHYVVPGVFFLIWGILGVLLVLAGLGLAGFRVWALINLSTLVGGDVIVNGSQQISVSEVRTADLIKVASQLVGLIFTAILTYIFISGGLAMLHRNRQSLPMARTAAVCAAIPCFGCLIWPFGIWGCISVFSDNAKRDFR